MLKDTGKHILFIMKPPRQTRGFSLQGLLLNQPSGVEQFFKCQETEHCGQDAHNHGVENRSAQHTVVFNQDS